MLGNDPAQGPPGALQRRGAGLPVALGPEADAQVGDSPFAGLRRFDQRAEVAVGRPGFGNVVQHEVQRRAAGLAIVENADRRNPQPFAVDRARAVRGASRDRAGAAGHRRRRGAETDRIAAGFRGEYRNDRRPRPGLNAGVWIAGQENVARTEIARPVAGQVGDGRHRTADQCGAASVGQRRRFGRLLPRRFGNRSLCQNVARFLADLTPGRLDPVEGERVQRAARGRSGARPRRRWSRGRARRGRIRSGSRRLRAVGQCIGGPRER